MWVNNLTASLLPTVGFTAGLAIAGASAISVPIIIHLLTRFRRERHAWGAMRFLLEAFKKHRTRLKMEQLILLIIRCLILALLGLALAGPMLKSCAALSALGPVADSGRQVHVVIDDALSTQAMQPDGTSRFEGIRKTALATIDALEDNDRVAVWRTARPAESLLAPASLDRESARKMIEEMKPRYSGSDLGSALTQVSQSIDESASGGAGAQQRFVVLISDFAAGSLDEGASLPAEAATLTQKAKVFVTKPMDERTNVQIVSIKPRRHMVLANAGAVGAAPIAPTEVTLRRFGDETADRLTGVELAVMGDDGKPIVVVNREHQWSAGQTEAVMNLDLPLTPQSVAGEDGAGNISNRSLPIRARLVESGADDLTADNSAFMVVELRKSIRVAMIEGPGVSSRSSDEDVKFQPRQWVQLALAPFDAGEGLIDNWPIETISTPADAFRGDEISSMDAAIVFRPDLLDDDAWDALAEFAKQGGLVWVMTPTQSDGASASWGPRLVSAFEVDWKIGIEMLDATGPDLGTDLESRPAGESESPFGWELATDADLAAVPEPLSLLSADWVGLLRPVLVHRRISIEPAETEGGGQNIWLRLNNEERSPLLVSAGIGDGHLLLLGTAIETDWTNLPTKPLFVPLLHETLRGLLGESPKLKRLSQNTAGDSPVLDIDWAGAERLVLREGLPDAPDDVAVLLSRTPAGLTASKPIDQPGVYSAVPEPTNKRIAVNVESKAGDTRPIDQTRLNGYLADLGEWQWLDTDDPAKSIASVAAQLSLAWPLLWIVVALVLVETLLARMFSHANTHKETTIAQLAGVVRRLHTPSGSDAK